MDAETRRKVNAGAWVMYDFTVNRLPRLEAFRRLVAAGFSRREAAEEIHIYGIRGSCPNKARTTFLR